MTWLKNIQCRFYWILLAKKILICFDLLSPFANSAEISIRIVPYFLITQWTRVWISKNLKIVISLKLCRYSNLCDCSKGKIQSVGSQYFSECRKNFNYRLIYNFLFILFVANDKKWKSRNWAKKLHFRRWNSSTRGTWKYFKYYPRKKKSRKKNEKPYWMHSYTYWYIVASSLKYINWLPLIWGLDDQVLITRCDFRWNVGDFCFIWDNGYIHLSSPYISLASSKSDSDNENSSFRNTVVSLKSGLLGFEKIVQKIQPFDKRGMWVLIWSEPFYNDQNYVFYWFKILPTFKVTLENFGYSMSCHQLILSNVKVVWNFGVWSWNIFETQILNIR